MEKLPDNPLKSRFFTEWALRGNWLLKPIGRYVKRKWPVRYRTIETQYLTKETRLCPHCTEKWDTKARTHLKWLFEGDGV